MINVQMYVFGWSYPWFGYKSTPNQVVCRFSRHFCCVFCGWQICLHIYSRSEFLLGVSGCKLSGPIDLVVSEAVNSIKIISVVKLRSSHFCLHAVWQDPGLQESHLWRQSWKRCLRIRLCRRLSLHMSHRRVSVLVLPLLAWFSYLHNFGIFSVESSRIFKILVQARELVGASFFLLCFSIWQKLCSLHVSCFHWNFSVSAFFSDYCYYFFTEWKKMFCLFILMFIIATCLFVAFSSENLKFSQFFCTLLDGLYCIPSSSGPISEWFPFLKINRFLFRHIVRTFNVACNKA